MNSLSKWFYAHTLHLGFCWFWNNFISSLLLYLFLFFLHFGFIAIFYSLEEKSLLWFKFLGVFGGIFIALYLLGLLWFIYHRSTSTKNKVQRSEQSIQNVYDDHPSRNTSRKRYPARLPFPLPNLLPNPSFPSTLSNTFSLRKG